MVRRLLTVMGGMLCAVYIIAGFMLAFYLLAEWGF